MSSSLSTTTKADTVGLSPGALVYVGRERRNPVRVTVTDYTEHDLHFYRIDYVEECEPYRCTPTTTWIDVDAVHDVEVVRRLGDLYHIDPLALEDIVDTHQRPKLEDYGDYVFIVLKMLYHAPQTEGVTVEQVSLIIGDHYVISFQEGIEGDVFDPVRRRLRTAMGRIRRMGPDYLAYALMDAIVDNYFIILEEYNEAIEYLQEELLTHPGKDVISRIHALEKRLTAFRKAVWPLRESIGQLSREQSHLFEASTHKYLRDLYDHVLQVIDATESCLDQLGRLHDIYLTSLSHRLNEVMKVLTILSAIFIPLTFVAGLYGMNFEFMPELREPMAYPLVLIFMALMSAGMLVYFKRRGWL